MTDMIVSGAGTTAVNGTYVELGKYNSRPYYGKGGAETPSIGYRFGAWIIAPLACTSAYTDFAYFNNSYYYSSDNVATPDLCTTWAIKSGALPVPTVTAASSGTTHEGEVALSSLSYLRTKKA